MAPTSTLHQSGALGLQVRTHVLDSPNLDSKIERLGQPSQAKPACLQAFKSGSCVKAASLFCCHSTPDGGHVLRPFEWKRRQLFCGVQDAILATLEQLLSSWDCAVRSRGTQKLISTVGGTVLGVVPLRMSQTA